MYLCPR